MTKERMGFLALCITILVVSFLTLYTAPAHVQEELVPMLASGRSISVSGEAEVTAVPDTAHIQLGVSVEHVEMKTAQAEASKRMNAVMKTLEKAGVDERDIQTTNYSVYPTYRWDNLKNENRVTGYQVVNQVQVTVRKIDDLGKVLDAVAKDDANLVSGIHFSLSNHDALYQEALAQAVENAHAKASAIAEVYGKSVAEPVRIHEVSGTTTAQPYYKGFDMARSEVAFESTPISQGEMTVKANVQAEFNY